jgi:hypothetical protein
MLRDAHFLCKRKKLKSGGEIKRGWRICINDDYTRSLSTFQIYAEFLYLCGFNYLFYLYFLVVILFTCKKVIFLLTESKQTS